MTKTFTTVVSHRFANPVLPVMIQLGTTVDGLFNSNQSGNGIGSGTSI
jgi:hypothetical protein